MASHKDFILYRIKSNGFHELLEILGNSKAPFTTQNLRFGEIICIDYLNPNIGPLKGLISLQISFKFNESMRRKIYSLSHAYLGWRPVRGDVIVGIIENIIKKANLKGFLRLHDLFKQVGDYFSFTKNEFESTPGLDALKSTCIKLAKAADNAEWQTVSRLEFDLNSGDTSTDADLMVSCRMLLCWYLLQNQLRDMNGLTLTDAILSTYTDVSNMESYCKKYVMAMGVDAEGPLVSGGLLFDALQCPGCLVLLDSRSNVSLSVLGFNCPTADVMNSASSSSRNISYTSKDSKSSTNRPFDDDFDGTQGGIPSGICATVHLLLRPGHYDLLYALPALKDLSGNVAEEVRKVCLTSSNDSDGSKENDFEMIEGSSSASGGFDITESDDGELISSFGLTAHIDNEYMSSSKFPMKSVRVTVCVLFPEQVNGVQLHGVDQGGGLVLSPTKVTVLANCMDDVIFKSRLKFGLPASRDVYFVSEQSFLRALFPDDFAKDASGSSCDLVEGATFYLVVKDVVTVWLRIRNREQLTGRQLSSHDQRWLVTIDFRKVSRAAELSSVSMSELILKAVQEFTVHSASIDHFDDESCQLPQSSSRVTTPARARYSESVNDKSSDASTTAASHALPPSAPVPTYVERPRASSVGRYGAHVSIPRSTAKSLVTEDNPSLPIGTHRQPHTRTADACSMCNSHEPLTKIHWCRHVVCTPCLRNYLLEFADSTPSKSIFYQLSDQRNTSSAYVSQPLCRAISCPVKSCSKDLVDEDLDFLCGSDIMCTWVYNATNIEKRSAARSVHQRPPSRSHTPPQSSQPVPDVSPQENSTDQGNGARSQPALVRAVTSPSPSNSQLDRSDRYASSRTSRDALPMKESCRQRSVSVSAVMDQLDKPQNDHLSLDHEDIPSSCPSSAIAGSGEKTGYESYDIGASPIAEPKANESSLSMANDQVYHTKTPDTCCACNSPESLVMIRSCSRMVCTPCLRKHLMDFAAMMPCNTIFYLSPVSSASSIAKISQPNRRDIQCPLRSCFHYLVDEDLDFLCGSDIMITWVDNATNIEKSSVTESFRVSPPSHVPHTTPLLPADHYLSLTSPYEYDSFKSQLSPERTPRAPSYASPPGVAGGPESISALHRPTIMDQLDKPQNDHLSLDHEDIPSSCPSSAIAGSGEKTGYESYTIGASPIAEPSDYLFRGLCLACYRQRLVCIISKCGHSICKNCFLAYLEYLALAQDSKSIFVRSSLTDSPAASWLMNSDTSNLTLRRMPCPISRCTQRLGDSDINCLLNTPEVRTWILRAKTDVESRNLSTPISTLGSNLIGTRSIFRSHVPDTSTSTALPIDVGSAANLQRTLAESEVTYHSSLSKQYFNSSGRSSAGTAAPGPGRNSSSRSKSTGRLQRGPEINKASWTTISTGLSDQSESISSTSLRDYEVAKQSSGFDDVPSYRKDKCEKCKLGKVVIQLRCGHLLCQQCLLGYNGKPIKHCPLLHCSRAISDQYVSRVRAVLNELLVDELASLSSLYSPEFPIHQLSNLEIDQYKEQSEINISMEPCSFFDVLLCSNRTVVESKRRIALACGHCFHVECLLRCLQVSISVHPSPPLWPVICPECERCSSRCKCERCRHHSQGAAYPEHILMDSELQELSSKLKEVVPAKAGEMSKIVTRQRAAVVATARWISGTWRMSCKCGQELTKTHEEYYCYSCEYSYCRECHLIHGHRGTCAQNAITRGQQKLGAAAWKCVLRS